MLEKEVCLDSSCQFLQLFNTLWFNICWNDEFLFFFSQCRRNVRKKSSSSQHVLRCGFSGAADTYSSPPKSPRMPHEPQYLDLSNDPIARSLMNDDWTNTTQKGVLYEEGDLSLPILAQYVSKKVALPQLYQTLYSKHGPHPHNWRDKNKAAKEGVPSSTDSGARPTLSMGSFPSAPLLQHMGLYWQKNCLILHIKKVPKES